MNLNNEVKVALPQDRDTHEPLDIITDIESESNPLIIKRPNAGNLADATHELSGLFFEWPTVSPDGVFQPMLVKATSHLQQMEIRPENLRAATLALMVLQSARLGHPLSMMLMPDAPHEAVSILDKAVKLAPNNSAIEFSSVKPELFFIKGGQPYRGKCVISADPGGFVKVNKDIELMLTRGHAVRQELVQSRFDSGLKEYRAEWPLSFIGLEYGKKGNLFNHPSILKVPIVSAPTNPSKQPKVIFNQLDLVQSPIFKIKKTFERLMAQPVIIPFADKLWESMEKSGCEHADIKMAVLEKMISLCAIINQPQPVTKEELGSYIYGASKEDIQHWMIEAGIYVKSDDICKATDGVIVATKVDYYLALLLLDGLISTGGNYLNDRQKRVFEMVKSINFGKVSSTSMARSNDAQKLATIASGPGYWAEREKVFEMLSNNETGEFSLSSISNDLVALFEMGLLDRAKPPKKRSFGYYILTIELNAPVVLPDPSQVQDPVFEGKSVEVINPLTGQVAKI